MQKQQNTTTHKVTKNQVTIFQGTVSECLNCYDANGGNSANCKIEKI